MPICKDEPGIPVPACPRGRFERGDGIGVVSKNLPQGSTAWGGFADIQRTGFSGSMVESVCLRRASSCCSMDGQPSGAWRSASAPCSGFKT
jgi:hypothetical protein